MSYIVATYFDKDAWKSYGLNWVRHAKSESLTGYIIGIDLPQEAIDKINELGFVHLPLISKYQIRGDAFFTLLQKLEKNQRCLWTNPHVLPRAGIESKVDLLCGISNSSVENLTVGVVNLYYIAAMIKSLNESIFKKHGAFLASDYILGTYDFWNGYVGCRNYLHEKQYLESFSVSDDLVLNFFMAFANSFSCEIQSYPLKEAA